MNELKCNFCDFKVVTQDISETTAMARSMMGMSKHIIENHPEEYQKANREMILKLFTIKVVKNGR